MSTPYDFAIEFAVKAGEYMARMRSMAVASQKLDRTDVTDIDRYINKWFITEVKETFGQNVSVLGEEASAATTSSMVWIIDPIDGTGEYIDFTITDAARTSCVGIAMFYEGVLQLSVVYNPFRNELFAADRNIGRTHLNGDWLDLRSRWALQHDIANVPYDYCHWDGAATDARVFESIVGGRPIGSYSAINQACDVARGNSAFAVFPGNTIHDIAPSVLQVELAGGFVGDTNGSPLNWNDSNHGVIYAANQPIYAQVFAHLAAQ